MRQKLEGYLIIADITGYTIFLSESELEHAEDSLRNLLELLIEHNKPPLVISRLQGDAVIRSVHLAAIPDAGRDQVMGRVQPVQGAVAATPAQ